MKSAYSKLFEPTNIGKLQLKNRTSMAPMGLVGYSDGDGGFNENAQEYYIKRAQGGVGLIITGICSINYYEILDRGIPCPTLNPLMFNMSTTAMNERIHAYDSKIFLQLAGGLGRSAIPNLVKVFYAPSENTNRFDPRIVHREITIDEIQMLIKDFVKSAAIAKASGFDGVEIHAVHEGYLLDQFAISCFNRRTDEYGGDLRARLKISTDIVKGIKATCGADFPVSLRFSVKSFMKNYRQGALPGEEFVEFGKDSAEGVEAAKILAEAGYDSLNIDAGTYDSWYWNHPPMYFDKGMYRKFGRMIKDAVNVPVILAGRMDDPKMAEESLLNGDCDIVSYGRPLLADAELVNKIKEGKLDDIRPCLSCHEGCMGRIAHGLPLSCAVNPACGREEKYGITEANIKKNVLIVGGGLAGMESARVCALRGHTVTLVEATDKLGGNVVPGAVPKFKADDKALILWYEKQLKDLKVEVQFNKEVDSFFIENFSADEVIIATGSKPIILDFGGKNKVITASDVLLGKEISGDNVVFIGGGLIGCETALWLAQQGKTVSIIEKEADILGGIHALPFMNQDMLRDLLVFHGISVYKGTEVKSVESDAVVVTSSDGTETIPADTVVLAVGYQRENELYEKLRHLGIPVYNLGDSRRVKNIMYSIWDAYEAARNI